MEYYFNSAAFTSANPTSETHQILYLFLGILKTNNLKKKGIFLFFEPFFCFFFSLILNLSASFSSQLCNSKIIFMSTVNDMTVIFLIWTYTRNIIIYLQIIYPCIFNQSINPVSFILTSPSYNFDISFLSRLRCSYSRTSPPPTVDIKVIICLRKL